MEWKIETAAREASKEISYNPELEEAFIAGARWTIERLLTELRSHPQEELAGMKATMDRWRLKDIKKFVYEMCEH